jgi:hypothetical protein
VAGPYSFTLTLDGQPGTVTHGLPIGRTTSAATSTKTVASAPTLPSSSLFNGNRSIKDTVLSDLVYKTL